MALSEFEIHKVKKAGDAFLEKKRPPIHIRNQLDLAWRLENQSVYIYETRPVWNNPSEYQTELNRVAHKSACATYKSAGVVDFCSYETLKINDSGIVGY